MYDEALVRRVWLLRGLLRYLEEHQRLLVYIREIKPLDLPALKFTEEEIRVLQGLVARASSAQTLEALEKILADIKSHQGFYGIETYVELPKISGTTKR